ncbi:hypothetical protein [Pseudoalteromonas sp. 68 DY56-GL68]|uniref:hypothetical protein n=1 Tax=Pseudoalteromonas sp. 68 DY56-GL68 TaxID=2974919 RepID=UPI00352B454D
MAGVNNQPNLKPLIDEQTEAQKLDFSWLKSVAAANRTKLDQTLENLAAANQGIDTTQQAIANAKAETIQAVIDKQALTDAAITAAKNAINSHFDTKVAALQKSVNALKNSGLSLITATSRQTLYAGADLNLDEIVNFYSYYHKGAIYEGSSKNVVVADVQGNGVFTGFQTHESGSGGEVQVIIEIDDEDPIVFTQTLIGNRSLVLGAFDVFAAGSTVLREAIFPTRSTVAKKCGIPFNSSLRVTINTISGMTESTSNVYTRRAAFYLLNGA